jgi:hypothetical protein
MSYGSSVGWKPGPQAVLYMEETTVENLVAMDNDLQDMAIHAFVCTI